MFDGSINLNNQMMLFLNQQYECMQMIKAQCLIGSLKMVSSEKYINPSNEREGKSCPEEHCGNLIDDKWLDMLIALQDQTG